MPSKTSKPSFVHCVGNPDFDPERAVADQERHRAALELLRGGEKNDFEGAVRLWFGLPGAGEEEGEEGEEEEEYVYHAGASVTLPQVQRGVEMGGGRGLHGWYEGVEMGGEVQTSPFPPSVTDITAYTTLFSPSLPPSSSFKSFVSNAKKNSIRALVAENLSGKRYIHPSYPSLQIPKVKKDVVGSLPLNPYLDFWTWTCQNLEWGGPVAGQGLKSHWVLPVVMHHFGCVVPSYEALGIIKSLVGGGGGVQNGNNSNGGVAPENGGENGTADGSGKKPKTKKTKKEKPPPPLKVLDVGSGNGYWSFMLRQYGMETTAVDNLQSEWRVTWIPDTLLTTGTAFLQSLPPQEHKAHILLLVYPITGPDGRGSFTRELMREYKGDIVVVAGTQNNNGYTSFGRGKGTMDSFMLEDQEQKGRWEKVVQVPLPSFAGRDEGLFVYVRKREG
ncbi:hypothetical protein QBC41DRAFT_327055 [Cercophora samala]|uniref:Uncharacterized protein n=1 Tax=Cercophora samala TaxID=330535 RepID=A0AA39Z856_9PEZI|nr:hypothetical protein QBC41DRAFT_327055 [Cercophora samala]